MQAGEAVGAELGDEYGLVEFGASQRCRIDAFAVAKGRPAQPGLWYPWGKSSRPPYQRRP